MTLAYTVVAVVEPAVFGSTTSFTTAFPLNGDEPTGPLISDQVAPESADR
jgi:hypothetical protein